MAKVQLPNGQYVNIDSSGNILNESGGIYTGGGAPVPAVENDPTGGIGKGGEGERGETEEQIQTRINSSPQPQPVTRNPGESASAYAERILNSPFYLAGTQAEGGNNAFVIDPITGKYASTSTSNIKRSVTSAPQQNRSTAYSTIGGGGNSSVSSDSLFGEETEAQKRAREYLDDSLKTPESEEEIVKRKTEEAKGRIQANKDYFQSLLTDQKGTNELRTRETNARAVLSGLSGSSEAGNMAIETEGKNTQANQKILAQQAVALEEIYAEIQNSAIEEARNQKDDAYKSAGDILERKSKSQEKAVADVTLLAKSGFDLESIRTNDPVTYKHLADSVGGEAQLKALSVLNRPQESIIDKRVENGKYIIAYQNPLTGKTRIESVDLDLPPNYSKSVDLGDRLMFIPENFDPTVDNPLYVSKGLSPKAPGEGTEGERKTEAFAIINKLIQPGVKDRTTGVPYISADGYLTFKGFKTLVSNAIEDNISRDEFIAQYADKFLPGRGKEYGLTAVEIKKYGI